MDDLLRLCGIHGIRWQMSLLRTVNSKAIQADHVPLAAYLHKAGKQSARSSMLDPSTRNLDLTAPLAAFKGKNYEKEWVGRNGPNKFMARATIVDVKEAIDDTDSDLAEARLVAKYNDNIKLIICCCLRTCCF